MQEALGGIMEAKENDVRQRKGKGTEETTEGVNLERFEYGSADAYATAVRTWLMAYNTWYWTQCMAPLYMQQTMNQNTQTQTRTTTTNAQQQRTQALGDRYFVATYGRRFLAELIDFCFCFVLKLIIVYMMVEVHLIDLERYERLLSDQADLQTLIDVTQDLFPIELANKLLTSIIEALYISYGFGSVIPGCTPGKFLMGIKVVSCTYVQALAPRDYRVVILGVGPVGFKQSLLRSSLKNFTLSFLFPLCMIMYAFKFNRSLYDITASTIVVEI